MQEMVLGCLAKDDEVLFYYWGGYGFVVKLFIVGVVNCCILCEGWPICPKPRSHMAHLFPQTSYFNPSCKNCCTTYPTLYASQP
jgi:hypothetical protein